MLDEPSRQVPDMVGDFLERTANYPAQLSCLLEHTTTTCPDDEHAAAERDNLASRTLRYRSELNILSTRATVPLKWLCPPGDSNQPCSNDETGTGTAATDADVRSQLKVRRFHSLVARDDLVIRNILHELVDRGACERGAYVPTIAIVAEQDTVYGRLFDDIVRDVAPAVFSRKSKNSGSARAVPCKVRTRDIGYLRGVDGEMPPGGAQTYRAENTTSDDTRATPLSDVPVLFGARREPSFGVAQLDYVRRLARRIARAPAGGGAGDDASVVAIGVFGSDVYDKLLILQALRERFPNVTFFYHGP